MSDADRSAAALSPAVLAWNRRLASISPGQLRCPGFRPKE